MPDTTEPAPDASGQRPLPQRLLWFIGLWVAGVGSVALVGFLIKLALKA
jgi:hypothetical protein